MVAKPRLRWAEHFGPDAMAIVRIQSYQVGLAEGELRGRMALARELEMMFGGENGDGMTASDAMRIRLRQVH